MKRDYTEEYIKLLESTLTLINQKQAYMQKLINQKEGIDRNTYTNNANRLTNLIEKNRSRMEELKKFTK